MARQADDAHVVGHVFAAELGAETDLAGLFPHLFLEFHVAESATRGIAGGGQVVVIFAGGEFHREEVALGGGAADDEGDVVRRAGGRAEGLHLAHEERHEGAGIEDGLGLLVEVAFVGAAAAFGDAQEAVFHSFGGLDVDLGRQIALGVDLFIHGQRCILAVAEILFGVGLENAFREGFLVAETGPDLLAFLSVDNSRASVLAEREFTLAGHFGVAQHRQGDIFVVLGSLGIVEDFRHLGVVCRAEHEGDVVEGGIRHHGERLGRHFQHRFSFEIADRDPSLGTGNLVVFSGIFPQLKHRSVFEFHIVRLLCFVFCKDT